MTFLRAMCVLMLMSGIGGVYAGDQAAVAGWWLIVVFGGLLLLTYVGRGPASSPHGRPRRRQPWLLAAGVVAVAIFVIAPIAFVMLAGGG